MSETLKIYASDSTLLSYKDPDTNYHSATVAEAGCDMLLKFTPTVAQLAALEGKGISDVRIGVYAEDEISKNYVRLYLLKQDYDLDTITYNSVDGISCGTFVESVSIHGTGYLTASFSRLYIRGLKTLLEYGLLIDITGVSTAKSSNPPCIEIEYEPAAPKYTIVTNRRVLASEVDNTISWSWAWKYEVWGTAPAITAQTMKWRLPSGTDVSTRDLGASTASAMIPAATFPTQDIQITIVGTTSDGTTSADDWYDQMIYAPVLSSISPTSGSITPKNAPALLTWTPQQWESDYYSLAHYVPVQQSSATITYRTTGTTSTTSISITDGTTSYTIPAGTFTADSIDWMVTATTVGGTTVSSGWATISTVDTTPSSKPVSPSGISIDATITNRFSWQHIISTGTAQTAADLQYSTDGSTWTDLASVTGSDQFYDVQADTFSAGTKFWRVRTYNSDSVAGEWSTAAQFVAIASPSTPAITVQSLTGRPSISWETSEQQAYQVKLSTGYESGTTYGTTQAWTAPYYLADGTYTVSVRVQNEYGLWSEWGTAALPVTHTAGDAITLTVTAEDAAAALTWTTSGSYDFYIIERNGEPISKTTGKSYMDALATGETTYRIVGGHDAGTNYTASSEVTETIKPGTNYLYVITTGEWIEMRTSETQLRQNTATRSVGLTTVHLAGLSYPVEELSGTADMTLTVTVAWPHSEAAKAKALEAAVGKLVCLKDTFGNQVIGTLATLECTYDKTMLRYAFTIQHTDYSEAVTL